MSFEPHTAKDAETDAVEHVGEQPAPFSEAPGEAVTAVHEAPDAAEAPPADVHEPAPEVVAPVAEAHETASFSTDPPVVAAVEADRIPDATPAPEPPPSTTFGHAYTPPADTGGGPVAGAQAKLESLSDRPEVLAGAAFAGGLVVALILKRLGR